MFGFRALAFSITAFANSFRLKIQLFGVDQGNTNPVINPILYIGPTPSLLKKYQSIQFL